MNPPLLSVPGLAKKLKFYLTPRDLNCGKWSFSQPRLRGV